MNKPRKWWLAGLLSILDPGLGQIYNGQAKKGLIILFLPLLFLPATILGLKSDSLKVLMAIYVILTVTYYLFVVADAIKTARKFGAEYHLKKYNKIITYIGIVILVGVLNTALSAYFKNNHVQAYKIPAASNEPTLLVGDHVLADRHPSARNPTRGDLIIFEFPEDPKRDFVKRVIGMEGDTVEIRDKAVFLNGKKITEPYAIHKATKTLSAGMAPRDFFGPATVPEESYFVLGDNRDRSYDSRFWGFIKKEKIKGTVKSIYWSWDAKNTTVRWDRIGEKMREFRGYNSTGVVLGVGPS